MTFYDPTLYGRDEEEEFGDSGAYSESLEEDFEEEEGGGRRSWRARSRC
jgi:hypothetical protein